MTKWQRTRYFVNEYVVLLLILAILFAIGMYYATGKTDWKPSAWILGVTLGIFVPFWLWKYFRVTRSVDRTTNVGVHNFGNVPELDNASHAGTVSAATGYSPPAQPDIPKPKGGIGLRWKIRLVLIGIGIIWAILDSEWKRIDRYFPKLNEYIHSGTPSSQGDIEYVLAHLQQDMETWAQTCPEKIGFQECRARLIKNKPILEDLNSRVAALNDAWVKELGERTVSQECQAQMNRMLTAYKDYVRAERNIVVLIEPMDNGIEESKRKSFDDAIDQENKASDELDNIKSSHVCDAY